MLKSIYVVNTTYTDEVKMRCCQCVDNTLLEKQKLVIDEEV